MSKSSCKLATASCALAAALSATAAHADNALTVVRDAQTGQLRAPTAAEAAALQGKPTRVPVTPARTLQKYHHSGARGVRLTNDFMSHTVVVRQADGTLAEQCFDNKEEADAAVKASAIGQSASHAKLEKE